MKNSNNIDKISIGDTISSISSIKNENKDKE